MKKILTIVSVALTLFVSSAVFTSCSKDSSDGTPLIEKIIGNWEINTVTVEVMGQKMQMTAEEAIEMAKQQAGSSNVTIIDQYLTIEEGSINGYDFVLDGKNVKQIFGMDVAEIEGLKVTVEQAKANSFIFRYDFGSMLKEDLKYVRNTAIR